MRRFYEALLEKPSGTTPTLGNHLKRHITLYAEYKETVKAKSANQPSVTDLLRRNATMPRAKREGLDLKIARMIAVDLQPYTIV